MALKISLRRAVSTLLIAIISLGCFGVSAKQAAPPFRDTTQLFLASATEDICLVLSSGQAPIARLVTTVAACPAMQADASSQTMQRSQTATRVCAGMDHRRG